MANYKKIYTLVVNHRCCTENHILVADTTRTFVGYHDQIPDWIDAFFISDYMSLNEDCPENGYIRTDIMLRIQYTDVYGDVTYDRDSHKFLKDEWDKFNSDKELIDYVERWIRDVDYDTNRARSKSLKDFMNRKYGVNSISQN